MDLRTHEDRCSCVLRPFRRHSSGICISKLAKRILNPPSFPIVASNLHDKTTVSLFAIDPVASYQGSLPFCVILRSLIPGPCVAFPLWLLPLVVLSLCGSCSLWFMLLSPASVSLTYGVRTLQSHSFFPSSFKAYTTGTQFFAL